MTAHLDPERHCPPDGCADDLFEQLPEPLRTLLRNVINASFDCGAWTEDEDCTYEDCYQLGIDAGRALHEELRREFLLLAKLAHPDGHFDNPLEALEAKAIRDRMIDWCLARRSPGGAV